MNTFQETTTAYLTAINEEIMAKVERQKLLQQALEEYGNEFEEWLEMLSVAAHYGETPAVLGAIFKEPEPAPVAATSTQAVLVPDTKTVEPKKKTEATPIPSFEDFDEDAPF